MSLSITQFKSFFKASYTHGSLIIAIMIPAIVLMEFINFVSTDFMMLVNMIIIGIELSLAFFKLGLNEFLKAKTTIAKVNSEIKAENYIEAKKSITNNISEQAYTIKETAKELIEAAKKTKLDIDKEILDDKIPIENIENIENRKKQINLP